MDLIPIFILGSTLISLGFTVFMTRRASTSTASTLEALGKQLNEGLEDVQKIIQTNSRAMGAISSLADDTKMDKALERRIGKDLMGEFDDILEIVRMTFPNVADYLDEHPEAITKVLPRLNTLISDPEARKRLKLDVGSKSGNYSRIWGEERG